MKYAVHDDSLEAVLWRAERYARRKNAGYTNANRAAQDRQILVDVLQKLLEGKKP